MKVGIESERLLILGLSFKTNREFKVTSLVVDLTFACEYAIGLKEGIKIKRIITKTKSRDYF